MQPNNHLYFLHYTPYLKSHYTLSNHIYKTKAETNICITVNQINSGLAKFFAFIVQLQKNLKHTYNLNLSKMLTFDKMDFYIDPM